MSSLTELLDTPCQNPKIVPKANRPHPPSSTQPQQQTGTGPNKAALDRIIVSLASFTGFTGFTGRATLSSANIPDCSKTSPCPMDKPFFEKNENALFTHCTTYLPFS